MANEPLRLAEDDRDPELAEMLRGAQSDVLSHEGQRRVRSRIAAAGALATAAAASVPAAAAAPALGMASKVLLVVVGLGGAAAVVVGTSLSREPAQAPRPPASAVPEVASAPVEELHREEPPPPAAVPSETEKPRPPTRAQARPRGEPVTETAVAQEIREGLLLLEARKALDKDPARALALVKAHRGDFPNSQLAPERNRIEAEAHRRIAELAGSGSR